MGHRFLGQDRAGLTGGSIRHVVFRFFVDRSSVDALVFYQEARSTCDERSNSRFSIGGLA